MKVIIAGNRDKYDRNAVEKAIEESEFEITEVVSGRAPGIDQIGEIIAAERGWPMKPFPADWKRYGKGAGPKRNKQMAEYADALIAVVYPGSKGTLNMIQQANKYGLKVFVRLEE